MHCDKQGRGKAGCLRFARGKNSGLDFVIAVQKHGIVRDRLLDELFDEEHLRTVDDGVDALLKGLHWGKGLEGFAEKDDGRVTALIHGHLLKGLQREIFLQRVRGETLFEDDHLITCLAEPDEKITVGCRGVDLVAQFLQCRFGAFEPFWRRECQQGRLVGCADEIKRVAHSYLILRVFGTGGPA